MTKKLDKLSEAELAQWHYDHHDELDADEGELVEVQIAPQFAVTMSFRLPGVEADTIRHAAEAAGVTLSEWIRQACADAADPESGPARRQQVDLALEKLQRQVEAARRVVHAGSTTPRPKAKAGS